MTYGQIVGLTFIVFGQIIVLMLVSCAVLVSLISVLAHADIRKHATMTNHIADIRGVDVNTPDDKKDRIIGFK